MQAYKKTFLAIAVLLIMILITFFVSLNLGMIAIAPLDVVRTLLGFGTERDELVLFDFRLPRMVIALLIGAGLAVSGAILQGVSQNGLADPGILGINAGAGLAVVLFIYFYQGSAANLGIDSIFLMPFAALLGGMAAAFMIYTIAWKKGVTPIRLILVGIGVNAAFGAALIIIQLKMDPQDFMQATIWLSGSIWGTNWKFVTAVLPWILFLVPFAIYKARYLNILNLGDNIATGLGAAVEKERRLLLVLSVALAGSCVAVGGGIAFLGLVAPHLARRIVGPKHQIMLPTAAIMGALLLLIADTIGRNFLAPSEIPVGIVVSAIGAPYFIYLLMKTN
ncbi:ferrichrome ABC transporter permease [Planococcus antarcticus DSM 14505]|uniref:Ferrichrome ABC transporter permease n=1 Tax=Planococcus antarcticus DSM 14505 TaxID=1185653 RepID=A0A1C7DHX1_9BACL|nr:iron ABC transporter permease [Planococcus antarcticus]ANU10813.1 iron ABC transporter permease [Planococcus antarcticus DSM 14505]EIM05119.1 ferrichrome ABC transporter permease [Planococcus antarcticus DSM 14505]